MDPGSIAGLLREYGGWGLSALLIGAVIWLTTKLLACHEARVIATDRMATLLERVAASMAASAAVLDSKTNEFGQIGQKVDEGNQSGALNDRLILERLDAVLRHIEAQRGGRP